MQIQPHIAATPAAIATRYLEGIVGVVRDVLNRERTIRVYAHTAYRDNGTETPGATTLVEFIPAAVGWVFDHGEGSNLSCNAVLTRREYEIVQKYFADITFFKENDVDIQFFPSQGFDSDDQAVLLIQDKRIAES